MNDTNALLIGLLQEDRSAALVKLRKYNGDLIEVAEHVGEKPWETLALTLHDTRIIKAESCFIFTNAELTTKMDWPQGGPSTWTYYEQWGKWKTVQDDIDEWNRVNAIKFTVLRQLFRYHWRWLKVTPDKLQSTRRLFDAD